ncbi:MAG: heme biosynthesis protein HemY [Pseudolabrys sp.]
MIRIVLFLLSLAVIAFGFAWMADRPGEVVVTWLGYRVEASLLVASLAIAVLILAAIAVWSIVRAILRSPEQVSLFFRHRRAVKGYLAITRGLLAVGSGDMTMARRSAAEAARLSPGDPLALLLEAQSAQLAGDRESADKAFRAMLEKNETKLLGLRGLYIEAQRRNDMGAARAFAEEAAKSGGAAPWAGQAVLDYRCASSDWAGALTALEATKSSLDKADYRRKRAVLLTARALAAQDSDRDAALTYILDAVKLAPDLVPAAAFAGRRLAEADNARKARKILEAAWSANPHPDIANAYADVRPGDSARERMNRIKKLIEKNPAGAEGALALSRAALDARDFKAARAALTPYLQVPTQRVAALMAEIEQAEFGDVGRAREWMMRAVRAAPDPAWTADGVVSDRWLPVSPATGALDAFRWKVPVAEIGIERPVVDVIEMSPPSPAAKETARDKEPLKSEVPAAALPPKPAESAVSTPRAKTPLAAEKREAEPVIPLVHAPDDPGIDAPFDGDTLGDPVPEAPPPRPDAWQRLRQLFR